MLWSLHDGAMWATPGNDIEDLSSSHPLAGDLRIHLDGTARKGDGNLNVVIGGIDRLSGITCHIGGFNDITSCRFTEGLDYRCLAEAKGLGPFSRDRTFHFSLRQEDGRLELAIDGQPVMAYQRALDQVPFEQSFAFDSCFGSCWSVGEVRIYRRRLPEHMSPLALGDDAMRRHDFHAAEGTYRALSEAFSGSEIGLTGSFKAAIAAVYAGNPAQGLAELAVLESAHPDHALVPRALEARLSVARASRDTALVDELLARLSTSASPAEYRSCLYDLASDYMQRLEASEVHHLGGPHSDPHIEKLVREAAPRVRQWSEQLGRPEVEDRFQTRLGEVLIREGRPALVLESVSTPRWRQKALFEMGRWDELLHDAALPADLRGRLLAHMGRYQEALRTAPEDTETRSIAFVEAGLGTMPEIPRPITAIDLLYSAHDIESMIQTYPGAWQTRDMLIIQGRYDEALLYGRGDYQRAYRVLCAFSSRDRAKFDSNWSHAASSRV